MDPFTSSTASVDSSTPRLQVGVDASSPIIGEEPAPQLGGSVDVSAPPLPIPKRRKIAQPSLMWNHFTRDEKITDLEKPMAKCNYCNHAVGVHHTRQGTSGMRSHLNGCLAYKRKQSKLDFSQSKFTHDASSKLAKGNVVGEMKIDTYDEKKVRRAIARFIIVDELPFRVVSKDGFKDMIHELEPRFRMPSRYTVMKDCMGLYLDENNKLRNIILGTRPRICYTTDTWTSVQNMNYMSVTGHFIDSKFVLHKRILGFRRVVDHRGVTIATELEECGHEWGIDKVLAITVDKASSNNVAVDHFKRRQVALAGGRVGVVVCGHEFIHMRCSAHILNLIVQDGLKEWDDSVVKVRNCVKYVKSSPQRLDYFRSCVRKRSLPTDGFLQLDVPTRWNSTYIMLDSAMKYEDVFSDMLAFDDRMSFLDFLTDDGHGKKGLGPPTKEDWVRVKHFVNFLKLFYNVTLRISASKTVTANLFCTQLALIYSHLKDFAQSDDDSLVDMAKRMQVKYDKYWGDLKDVNRLLFVAAALDPQLKLGWLRFWFSKTLGKEEGRAMTDLVRSTLDRLFVEYNVAFGNDNTSRRQGTVSEAGGSSSTASGTEDRMWSEYMSFMEEDDVVETTSEVDRYVMEPPQPRIEDFDILAWWKVNQFKFPILARIARDVLAIPITTVPSKSVFSTGGRVLDAFRSSLAPRTVEGLICAQNWLQSASIHEDAEGELEIGDGPDGDGTEYLASYNVEKDMANNPTQLMSIISVSNTDSMTLDVDD